MKWLMREQFSCIDIILFIWIGRCVIDGLYLYAAIIFGVFIVFTFIACYRSKKLEAEL